ncbi:MAG: DUF5652 family protein [bacterium]
MQIEQFTLLLPLIVILGLWDLVWKATAMWKASRNNQLVWYICLLVFNTLGILPIVYIFLIKKK